MNECACGCGNPVAPGKTWLRGHNMRVLAAAPVPDHDQDSVPDHDQDQDQGAWWDEQPEPGGPLTYDDAAELTDNDPAPARMARPGDSSAPKVTVAVRKDIEGKMAFWLSLGGDLWNTADPYCAGVFADNVDKIAKKSAPLICQSPDMVRFFQRASGFMMWTELGMACKPVILAVIAHHVTRRVEVHRETGEAQQADWSAYSAALHAPGALARVHPGRHVHPRPYRRGPVRARSPVPDQAAAMSEQQPELAGQRVMQAPPAAMRAPLHSSAFTWPERIPWSLLGPEFAVTWGRADPSDPQPEHAEVIGPNGSGKTHLLATMLRDRQAVRDTPAVLITTKPADATVLKLGWPVTQQWGDVRKYRQCIFWPRTKLLGAARKQYQEKKIRDLLERLWTPDSNTIVAFDDIGYVESLSAELRSIIEMYWREARGLGITGVGMKQRPQGANRHMSSETWWTAAFVPKDRADLERFAELFGAKRDWMPVFDAMDPDAHEFVLRHSRSRVAYISWVDTPLRPVRTRPRTRTAREYLFGTRSERAA